MIFVVCGKQGRFVVKWCLDRQEASLLSSLISVLFNQAFHFLGLRVNSLSDLLWSLVRWAIPITFAGVVAAIAVGTSRINDEI